LIEGGERCLLVETGLGVVSLRQFVDAITAKLIIAFSTMRAIVADNLDKQA
jgi:hypothetical protein